MRRSSFSSDSTQKIILLGNSSVGKTSLANRWLNNTFESTTRPTIGASNTLKALDIDDQDVKVTLWDTAGQEQYRSIAPLYVRGAKVAIIVASATDQDSFTSIPFWRDILTSAQAEEIKTILAVNKTDIIDIFSLNENNTENKNDDASMIVSLIEEYKIGFDEVLFVSAKTGENVSELFTEAARLAVSMESSMDGPPLPVFSDGKRNSCC